MPIQENVTAGGAPRRGGRGVQAEVLHGGLWVRGRGVAFLIDFEKQHFITGYLLVRANFREMFRTA